MKFDTEQMANFLFRKSNALKSFREGALGLESPPEEDWNNMATILAAMAVMSPENKPVLQDEIWATINENGLFLV